MFTLLAAGTGAFWLTIPISVLIVAILGIIVVSYRQTIRAYPTGGGSYIVAKENLGTAAGLVAAAALLVDYVLTVSVSVAAGVAAITSAFPEVSGDLRVPLAAASIIAVMIVNLRGIRESGTVFAIPTYVFLVSMLAMIAIGIGRSLLGDVPHVDDVRAVAVPAESLGLLLLMRAFADGCSAITGVEAVSNGVPAFKSPEASHARTTLAIMGVLVGVMFLGISWLAGVVGAVPSEHETVISQIGRAVLGSGVAYYVLQLSTMGILVLAANTSLRRLPAAGVAPRARWLHAQPVCVSRGAARVQHRYRRPRGPLDRRSRRVRGPSRSAHPVVRNRGVHLDHAVAGRDGRPLAAGPRATDGGGASRSTALELSRPAS